MQISSLGWPQYTVIRLVTSVAGEGKIIVILNILISIIINQLNIKVYSTHQVWPQPVRLSGQPGLSPGPQVNQDRLLVENLCNKRTLNIRCVGEGTDRKCQDINECSNPLSNSYCGANAHCANQVGWTSNTTFTCRCNQGFYNWNVNSGLNIV